MAERILKAACVQMTSGPDIAANLRQAAELIKEAASEGAQLISTPENTCHIRSPQIEKLRSAPLEKDHPALPYFAGLAREFGVRLHIGSISIKLEEADRVANRSYLFDEKGDIAATYDKIHLFDVDLPTGESHRESKIFKGGDRAVSLNCGEYSLGLSICYDVRFAYLYRDLAKHGANIMMIPAAFTVPTGQAHWKELIRARSIETGSFSIAAAQCGTHEGGRQTYGHSMIVCPWGNVIAEAGDEPCVILADLDLSLVEKARNAVPALRNDRPYTIEQL